MKTEPELTERIVRLLFDERHGKREGGEVRFTCLAHDDEHPSARFNDGKGVWTCDVCKAGGGQLDLARRLGLTPKREANPRRKHVAAYDYRDETGALLFQVLRYQPKDFRQRRPDGKGGWLRNLDGVRRVPYRLPEILAADSSRIVLVSEGEKDCERLEALGLVATTNSGGAGKWQPEFSEALRGRRVVILPHADEPGRKHAEAVARSLYGVAARVSVLELARFPPAARLDWRMPEKGDLSDWLDVGGTAEELDRLALEAPEWKPLEGGPLAELLEDVARFCRRFLVLSNGKADVLALWAAHTHAIEAFDDTPFLAVTSAEPESGKTRVLEVLELLVRNPWKVVLPSEAVLYRKVSAGQITLLLDEVDAVFGPKAGEHEGLRALLNAGNRRGTKVPRCVGRGEIRLEEFDVFCPRALAGIGKLPDTVASRSIPLSLKRRALGEMVEQLRRRDVEPEGHSLRDRLSAWAEANVVALRAARPASPESLRDRTADSCEPLLAIADAAGGEWPDRSRQALVELCAGDKPENDSLGIRLLRDCRSVFDVRDADRLPSAELCAALVGLEEAPWCELHKGRPLTVHGLAKRLNPYGVLPGTIRLENGTAKGYYRATFEDPWKRYCPEIGPRIVTPSQANSGGSFLDSSNRHTGDVVTDEKGRIGSTSAGCDGVPDESPLRGGCAYHVGRQSSPCERCSRPFEEHGPAVAEVVL